LKVRGSSIDLVITSPPYLNAIDYMRCSKFSLVWMGCSAAELRLVRKHSVGTEVGDYAESKEAKRLLNRMKLLPALTARHRALLARFIQDMRAALSEVARILVPGGRAVYVIGENTIRGVYIRNAEILIAAARGAGLRLERQTTRLLPNNRRYLPPPSRVRGAALDTRMRREVVLSFRKPKPRGNPALG
jgi:DNA modification methylase